MPHVECSQGISPTSVAPDEPFDLRINTLVVNDLSDPILADVDIRIDGSTIATADDIGVDANDDTFTGLNVPFGAPHNDPALPSDGSVTVSIALANYDTVPIF